MRDFTWHVFTQTGDIEAYLLYKEMIQPGTAGLAPDQPVPEGEGEEDGAGALS
ncbi:YqzL family protein [Cohnella sp. GbtcB17]|uniref:YqzL family protein n=1 Tax=Cohnella sp. GbtcB17 TaxID=2824762 RepID=UPI001C2F5AB4